MFRSTFFFSSFDSTVFAFFFFFNDTATTEIYTLSLHDALPISLFEQVGYDDAFTFKYSPREGTPATRLKDAVPDDVAGERLERLIALVRGLARRKNVGLVGTTHEVLVEGRAKRGALLQGRTRTNKVALFAGHDDWIGSYRELRLKIGRASCRERG